MGKKRRYDDDEWDIDDPVSFPHGPDGYEDHIYHKRKKSGKRKTQRRRAGKPEKRLEG